MGFLANPAPSRCDLAFLVRDTGQCVALDLEQHIPPEVQSVTHGSRLAEMRGLVAEEVWGPEEPEGLIGQASGGSPMGEISENEVPHGPDSDFLELPNKKKLRRPMEQTNNVRKRGGGKHFTFEERIRLETLDRTLYPGKKNPNFSELGRRLSRHRTSVSREYRRGTVMNKNTQLEEFQVYSAAKGGAWFRNVRSFGDYRKPNGSDSSLQ